MKAQSVPAIPVPGQCTPDAPVMSRRERNKLDKRTRIIAAARELFARQGYDGTTTQQIATEAGVASGTVFLYARAKEDLLVLVFYEDGTGLVADAARAAARARGLEGQLLVFFGILASYHERDPVMSRALMRQLTYVARPDGRELVGRLMRLIYRELALLIERAKRDGTVDPATPTLLAARSIFALYHHELGSLLGGYMNRSRFDRLLQSQYAMLLRGFGTG